MFSIACPSIYVHLYIFASNYKSNLSWSWVKHPILDIRFDLKILFVVYAVIKFVITTTSELSFYEKYIFFSRYKFSLRNPYGFFVGLYLTKFELHTVYSVYDKNFVPNRVNSLDEEDICFANSRYR